MKLRILLFAALMVVVAFLPQNVLAQLTGVKTVGGSSPDYTTLADAITALNSSGVGSGGVTFSIRNGTQTGGVSITATGTAANPIVFQSASLDATLVTISSGSSSDVITLTGCSYITFNQLTIDYTGSSSYSAIEIRDNSDNVTISNCIISGSSSTSTTFTASAIYASETSSTLDCQNFLLQNTEISNGSYGIYFDMSTSLATGFSVQGCEFIDNAAGGMRLGDLYELTVTGNSIHRSITNNTFYGMYLNNCDGQGQITQNYIYTTGSGEVAYGVYLTGSSASSGSNATLANNSIQVTNGASSAYCIDQASSSKYWNIYSNTLYVSGGTSSSSYCYRSFTSSDDTKIMNNVFCHEGSSTSSSANFTVYIGNASGVGAIDYNCYYTVNTGNPFRGRYGSSYTNFSSWTGATSESNSVNIDPVMTFTSGVGWKATANALTGDGTNLGLTTDVDGDSRDTPTTIGAHENGAGSSPNIIVSVTSLPQFITSVGTPSATQTYTVEGENLTANITITAPTNWQVKQQGVGSFGTTVTLVPSSGTVSTTTIEARYNPGSAGSHTGNITHTSTGATQKDVAVTGASTNCSGTFSGTYTINSSLPASCTNYKSFGHVVSDLLYGTRVDGPTYFNGPGIDGAVTFNVANGTYNEQLEITEVSGASSSNTITFKSASGVVANVVLQQASSSTVTDNFTLNLDGADYITFKDMTLKRTGSNAYAHVIEMHGDASNNSFENVVIEGRTGSTSENAALVWAGEDNANNSDNSFEDSHFLNGSAGIWYDGTSSNYKSNISITGNTFENYRYGVYLRYLENVTINDNTFINAASYNPSSTQGIYAFHLDDMLTIRRNEIYLNRGTNVYGMELLSCVGDNSNIGTIANNMVAVGSSQSETSSGAGDGTGTTNGIYMTGTTYKGFYHNSWLTTSTNPTAAKAFYVNGPSPNGNINLINNVFAANGGGYCFYNSLSSGTILTSDYNDFYSTGGSLFAYWGGAASNLSALQSNSGMDANSVSADPEFTSNTDLHASGTGIDGYGTPTGITLDIDGQTRDASNPDIGADEIDVCVSPTVDTDPSSSTICEGGNTLFGIEASGTSLSYQWRANTGGGFLNINNTGPYSNTTTDSLVITGATLSMDGYTYYCVVSGACTPNDTSNIVTLNVNALPAVNSQPSNSSISAGGNTSFTVGASGTGLSYQWQVNTGGGFTNVLNVGVYSGANSSTLNITGATLSMNGYTYQCLVSGTCTPSVASSIATLTVATPIITWNGSIDTDWFDDLNWTPNQVPTSTDDVVIVNVLNDPVISGNGATGRNISLVTGATVTVNNGYTWAILGDISANGNSILGSGTTSIQTSGTSTLTGSIKISGVFSVVTGATFVTNGGLTLENGASLMHGSGTLGGGGTVTGSITVKRTGTSNSFVYNMWSSPVVGAVLPGSNQYVYVPSQGTHSPLDDNPGPDPGWSTNVGSTMTAAKGYISTNGGNASFTGVPNNGNKTLGIATSLNPLNSLNQGSKFNLVGNPYPSAVDADDLISGNSGIIAGALYFWDDDLSGGGGYSSADYAIWTGIGSVGGGGNVPNGSIASCQGFFIEALNNNNITFTNSMRTTNNSQFFKMDGSGDLKVYMGFEKATKFNEILVAFLPDATEQRDVLYDAYKISALAELSLSAVQGEDDFAIVAFPDDNLERVVPLHLRVDSDGEGTFMLTRSENLGNNQVFLYDQLLNVMHNITVDTAYNCDVTIANAYDRFYLYFNPTITGQEEIENSIRMYCWNNVLFISNDNVGQQTVHFSVYDMQGREVFARNSLTFNGQTSVQLNGLATGVYSVKLFNEGHSLVKKVFVK